MTVANAARTAKREVTLGMGKKSRLFSLIVKQRWLLLMFLPGLLYFIIFKYWPMSGVLIAFQNFKPNLGISGSEWVGLKHFIRFFHEPQFWMLFRNTLIMAFYNLAFFFPIPILLAIMLNELRNEYLKKSIQSMIYVPHFMSWVVIVGVAYVFFTTEGGIVNTWISNMGMEKIHFLDSAEWFRFMIVSEAIWKEAGWGTIIFLAALAGVDPQLYEAARVDGASRLRQIWHITLPALSSTIVILLILRMGHFLDAGFEQIFLMLNALNREVGDVFDTYVYDTGIPQGQFSYSTAVGLFKSVIGLLLVMGSNYLAKRFGQEGVY